MRVISLGWGLQSFALAAMSALGELPPVDAAIHADTTYERTETYEFAKRWTPWLEERGVKVVTVPNPVTWPNGNKAVFIPAFTVNTDGEKGMLRRSCTERWKIRPIRKWLQSNRDGAPVELWLGYTQDEVERAKPSNVKYVTNRFPFLERGLQRWQVEKWLLDNGLEVPVKSGCVFCPFHSAATWKQISESRDWTSALDIDRIVRDRRPNHHCYLVNECVPLSQASFNAQMSFYSEECEGYCFL